ncbi:MAG TPA: cell wall-binding repeat-containing protein, partial [Coriobacteriia bacterium]|nr:cell wall-binding repeat-containing protein [Coriobacteriia bacterium]
LPDNGLDAVELDFTHEGALPGPASVSVYVGDGLAAKMFHLVQYSDDEITTTSLSDPVDSVTVDADGYVTIAIDTGDVWYLLEDVETVFVRYDGASRFETASEAALADFPKGADVAIVAYAWDFPDALAASALAGVANAPILLTDTDVLSPVTASTLEALGVQRVYVVGGRSVVSEAVLNELAGDYTVRRLGGVDRYATARLIADEAVRLGAVSDKAFLAYGGNFADALSVSSVAAQKGIPVLLTRTATLDAGAAAFIDDRGVDDVYIAGGELVVSEDVEIAVEAFGTRVTRWGGDDRYETAAAVADGSKSAFGVNFFRVGIASGTNFPDALAAGAALGMQDGMLLITHPLALSAPTEGLIVANSADILSVEFFGGTVALSQVVEDRVRELLQ